MDLVITNGAKEIIYTEQAPPRYAETDETHFSEHYGDDKHSFWQVDKHDINMPGVHIGSYRINVKEEIHLHAYDPTAMPGLFFVERGVISSKLYHHPARHHFQAGQHSILFNPFSAEDTLLQQQPNLQLFIVRFTTDHFLRLADSGIAVMANMAESVLRNDFTSFQWTHNLIITSKMREVIGGIKSCTFEGGLKKLFLQAKVMELLSLQCAQLEKGINGDVRPLKLSAADIAKIHLAREIITADIQHPPSLTSLARLTGLNEFKLKAGFKTVFSTSVFGYLNDYRLELGRKQVLKQNKSLTEIAYETGYASLSNFSNAFKKKYGVSPLKIR